MRAAVNKLFAPPPPADLAERARARARLLIAKAREDGDVIDFGSWGLEAKLVAEIAEAEARGRADGVQDCETACQVIADRYFAASERKEDAGESDWAERYAGTAFGAQKCVVACKALRTERATPDAGDLSQKKGGAT